VSRRIDQPAVPHNGCRTFEDVAVKVCGESSVDLGSELVPVRCGVMSQARRRVFAHDPQPPCRWPDVDLNFSSLHLLQLHAFDIAPGDFGAGEEGADAGSHRAPLAVAGVGVAHQHAGDCR